MSQTPPAAAPAASRWNRRHLLALADLSAAELRTLLRAAAAYVPVATRPETDTQELAGRAVATLFFEDSTRTRTSFTLAARRLGATVVDLSSGSSSVNKGESLLDTARTIEAQGVSAMVVRTKQAGAAALVARGVGCAVLNAGDGRHEHPTQGLLDLLTLAEAHGRLDAFDLAGLTLAIVGDVVNSRVARSAIAGATALGARVVCVGPPGLAPASLAALGRQGERQAGCEVSPDLDAVLPAADAVMMLRVQFERHEGKPDEPLRSASVPSPREFRTLYGLSEARAERLKPGAIVMHPGPMNRGLEIDGTVADGPRSVILRQVSRGVAVRMATLRLCVG
ncbi:MAG: aspartate carbamoyltransferase catalytic subunit [Phycisphaerales bacterium]